MQAYSSATNQFHANGAKPRLEEMVALFRNDFVPFAHACLMIRDKAGAVVPLRLNQAQLYIHKRIEEQKSNTGRVRAIILKGRQQGASTYTESRLYWLTSGFFGRRAYVLAHEQAASDNLFDMAKRYHDNCPALVRPHTGTANAKELLFDKLDSGYKVATAGARATGRSGTAQYFHGSEVAYWPDAEMHMAGIGQTVPDLPGTEIILESTANGLGNVFHKIWQLAEREESDYIAIFVPWYWQKEYRKVPTPGFVMEPEESELAELFGLDIEQIAWRRAKINGDFQGDVNLFRQEYPCTPTEAFLVSGGDGLIKPETVMVARRCTVENPFGALVIGVDPARFGDDSTSIAWRKGRKVLKTVRYHRLDTMEIAGRVAMIITEDNPAMVFIDVGGLGAGVVDRLNEMGFSRKITAVNFGAKSIYSDRYHNMRAQLWGELGKWLKDQPADIPDSDVLHGDMVGPLYSYDSNQRLKLECKEDMRKRGLSSPDEGDAVALTFTYPVAAENEEPKMPSWRDRLKNLNRSNIGLSHMAF